MKRTTIVIALSTLWIGASSCSSCESCKGSSGTADAGRAPTSDAASPDASGAATASVAPSASMPPLEANYACRMLARAITSKACDCPQKNKAGCCFFGAPGVGAEARAPFVSCSGGKTNWPSAIEADLCKVGKDEKKKELLMSCYAAKEKLRCGRTEGGDVGAQVPKECEALLKEALGAK